jgi:AcrR family transcriptional regulator
MPRTAADNQKIKDERREDILLAARAVFARKGLAGAKISDVAQAAGLSHGLVYHYFESKEAMYADLVEGLFARATLDLERLERPNGSPLARIRAFVEQRLARIAAEPDMFGLVLQACMHPDVIPTSTRTALDVFAVRCMAAMSTSIHEGQRRGELVAGDPAQLASALFALVNGLAMFQSAELDVPRVIPTVDMILGLIVSGARHAR